jgi:hypothetical protein
MIIASYYIFYGGVIAKPVADSCWVRTGLEQRRQIYIIASIIIW